MKHQMTNIITHNGTIDSLSNSLNNIRMLLLILV